MPWRSALDALAAIAMIVAAGSLVYAVFRTPSKNPQPTTRTRPVATEPVSLDDASLKGSATARVVLIEYADFECPYCAAFARDTMPLLETHYVTPGKVLIAFRHLPLQTIHRHAWKAAEAAECARRQGKFWQMHDLLFQNQRQLDEASLEDRGQIIGLEIAQFRNCLKNNQAAPSIKKDLSMAAMMNISGTPTFLFGALRPDGRVQVVQRAAGALDFKAIASMLEKLLQPTATAQPEENLGRQEAKPK
jgi:protein-disulfide isomerase